ncbi:hypothetical protein [Paenibacillus sp. FSL H7-0331]|uniref:hypothetical protein n=1 Tax=Paenibacillus sp. FSL H7-0331 TaxID=1920421 RepID=UPI00096D6EBD|nr:hypothetical protein [Paenibacillus sp. FSL H7-0331]OMF04755.1 hypothetical protein BK127_33440 [Paenibacillus sp. FSL H7-0331]
MRFPHPIFYTFYNFVPCADCLSRKKNVQNLRKQAYLRGKRFSIEGVVVLLESNCKERVNVLHVEIKNEWFAGTVWKAETDSPYITKVSGRYTDNGVSADLQSLYAKESERSICNFNNNDLYFLDRFNNEFIRSNNTIKPNKISLIGISLITFGLIIGVVIFALIELRSKSSR